MGEFEQLRRPAATDQQAPDSERKRGNVLQDNRAPAAQRKAARPGGLPERMKSGIESLSGMSMDHVRVHYNSPKPAQLNAHAYAQGNEIHVAPGQAHQLPHEAWHMVQQAQGRVKPTKRIGKTPINDDAGLEMEADRMGARAAAMPVQRRERDTTQSSAPALGGAPVLQGNFPDAANEERRGEQTIVKSQVQMDHMVPQETLRTLTGTLATLDQVSSPAGSQWEALKAAMDTLRNRAGASRGEHELLSEGHLVNIPENIVPGRAKQIQGAGNYFDPQMESGDGGVIKESAFSLEMRKLDDAVRELNHFVSADVLPTSQPDARNSKKYDDEVEGHLIGLLNVVSAQLKVLNDHPTLPSYNGDHWYRHGDDKWVKKRSATWKDDLGEDEIGTEELPDGLSAWGYTFTFHVKSSAKDDRGAPQLVDVEVETKVNVPVETWEHIYQRHYLPTFAWDIQAVNTFWKTDPSTYLRGSGKALLTAELTSLMKKDLNFSKPVTNMEDGDEDGVEWSQAEQKLFFQGEASTKFSNQSGYKYKATVDMKSIAPQSEALAFAVTPAKLTAMKPAPEEPAAE